MDRDSISLQGDIPPPTYEEAVADGLSSGPYPSPSTLTPRDTPQTRSLPLDFNVYSESATSSDVWFIGPHQSHRLFALTMHRNSFAQRPEPFLMLHDGLTRHDPVLGASTNSWGLERNKYFDDYTITAGPLGKAEGSKGSWAMEERLSAVDKGTYWRPDIAMRYNIQCATLDGDGGAKEASSHSKDHDTFKSHTFEWQESSSPEVLRLGGETRGWRLVAVADADNEAHTLAVCAPIGHSLTKFLRFSFRGDGRTGRFRTQGCAWETVAVLTGLTTWHRRTEKIRRGL